jgi:hypothetical protein
MRTFLTGAALASLVAVSGAARADEPVVTARPDAPVVTRADQDPQAIGDWARGVMDAPLRDVAAAPSANCAQPGEKRQPRGEVSAGVGTHGYRELGAVVTQPIGKCASLTVAVSRAEANFGGRRR